MGSAIARVQAEEDLRRAKEDLEIRVAERTAQLQQANEWLEEELRVRRTIEQSLRQSEAKYRTLVEQIPAITYICSIDSGIDLIYVSPQIETLLGFSTAEWLADGVGSWKRQLHPDDREQVMAELTHSFASGDPFATEYRVVAKSGRVVWFRDEARVVYDQESQFRFLQGLALDITAKKEAEEALKESQQELRLLTSQLLIIQEKERRRIARELHDELGQALTVLKIKLVAIEDKLTLHPLKANCEQVLSYIDTVIENVRRLSWDLSPSSLEDLGLSSALRNLVEETCRNHNLQSSVEMDEIDSLFSPEVQINIYRIFQESLTNVVKHARANQVSAKISRENGQVSFMIWDDGRGFNVKQAMSGKSAKRSLGLTALNERVLMAQGSLQISSRRGRGTTIAFAIPTINRAGTAR